MHILFIADSYPCKMADAKAVKVGTRVEVVGKGVVGTVAYVGATQFSSGKFYRQHVIGAYRKILCKPLVLKNIKCWQLFWQYIV